MALTNLGRVCFIPKGTYNKETEYKRLDVVFDPSTGNSYVAIDDSVGVAVTDTTKWKILIGNNASFEQKIDKVNSAKEDCIAVFDGAGGLKDSAWKIGDFATAQQGEKADNAVPKTEFDGHIRNENNPHNITASQIGACTTEQYNNLEKKISSLSVEEINEMVDTVFAR